MHIFFRPGNRDGGCCEDHPAPACCSVSAQGSKRRVSFNLTTQDRVTGHHGTAMTFGRAAGAFWRQDFIESSPEEAMFPTCGQQYGANAFQTQDRTAFTKVGAFTGH